MTLFNYLPANQAPLFSSARPTKKPDQTTIGPIIQSYQNNSQKYLLSIESRESITQIQVSTA